MFSYEKPRKNACQFRGHKSKVNIFGQYAKMDGTRRRSTSFKIGNSRIPPTVRICISLIFSLIMVGFAWGLK